MKFFILISLNFLIIKANAQTKNINLKIFKIADTISKESDLSILLLLSNDSNLPLIIPGKFWSFQLNDSTDIYYELLYLDNNKSKRITKNIKNFNVDINYIMPLVKYKILDPKSNIKIESFIDYIHFKKNGKYKIRFSYRPYKLNNCYKKKIATEWITFYFNNPNIN